MGNVAEHKVIAITGAAGYIGRHTLAQARVRGLHVVAIVRDSLHLPESWRNDAGVEVVVCDLAQADAAQILTHALKGTHAIIHAAGAMSGDVAVQQRDTLAGTTQLLEAVAALGTEAPKLIHVSSMAVYGYDGASVGDLVDENTPLVSNPTARDIYCQTKLAQEDLVRRTAAREGLNLIVLRPGAVFGPDRLWSSHLGVAVGPLLVRFGTAGQVPVCFVQNCATALVLAALWDRNHPGESILNVIDTVLPDRGQYLKALGQSGWPRITVSLPLPLVLLIGRMLSYIPGLGGRLPGVLRPAELRARMLPVRFSNAQARACLDWSPDPVFGAAFSSAVAQSEPGRAHG